MKNLIYILLLQLLIAAPCADVNAGVAEASTGNDSVRSSTYDLTGMSASEIEWFSTFINGTFYADGWQEISDNILVRIDAEEREFQSLALDRLGYKIGREWCRDNNQRKISTPMLRKWGQILKTTASDEPHLLAEVLKDIDGEVDSLLR